MIDIDIHIVVTAFIGGFLFFNVLCRLVAMLGFILPHVRDGWLIGLMITLMFFITYFAPLYINRLIDGRELVHSVNPLLLFIFYILGALVMYIIYSRRLNGET